MKRLKLLMTMAVCSGFLLPISGFDGLFLHKEDYNHRNPAEERAIEAPRAYIRIKTKVEASSNTSNNDTGNARVLTGASTARASVKTTANDGDVQEEYNIEVSPEEAGRVLIDKETDARTQRRNNNHGLFSPLFSELLRLFGRY